MSFGNQPVDRLRAELVGERLLPGQDTVLEGGQTTKLLARALSLMHDAMVVDQRVSLEGGCRQSVDNATAGSLNTPDGRSDSPLSRNGQKGPMSPAV